MIEIPFSGVAISIGAFSIRWYGIFVTLGVAALIGWNWRACRDETEITAETVLTTALVGIPSGIIFARLVHVIDRWDYYGQHLDQIIGGSGLTIWGAVLGAALGVWIYFKVTRFGAGGRFVDLIAPGILIAQIIGRIGCTINGCCYGISTALPWGIIYTHPQSYGPIGIPVHPTQVYEIIYNLIALGVLLSLRNKLKPDGSIFLIYLSLYSVWRVGVGFLRDGMPFLFGLHQAQVIAIIVLLICVPLLVWRTRRITPG